MARSNGPFGPAGARPPARRHPADDPFAAPPNGQWSPPQYPDPAHVAQQGQGYHFPPEAGANYGYQQQQPAPFSGYQSAPQHDPYAQQQQWGQPDPRAYDLGTYMPNAAQQPYPPMDPPPFQQGPHQDPYGQPGYADPDAAEYDEEFAEDEAPSRGRRWMLIVAALVGAVGVGGALAYTYKSFVAPNGGRVPLVKADPNVKVRPDNRNLAPSDKRMQGRLGDDAGQPPQNVAAVPEAQDDRSASDEPGGPRRVRTIPITPGGGPPPGIQVAPTPAAQAAPPPYVPGIMLENMGPRPQQPPPPRAAPQQPPRVTIGQPPPPSASPPQVEEPPAPPVRRAATPPQAPVKVASPPKASPPPAASSGAGYVAVLSSQKTRMDALKAFADLQQKYGEALSGRVPDVQEANLGEKGIWYRVVVGPPGSRDAANGVCSQLKSAGYSNCWVNSY
ncbi:MAG: SPOR domain-containing protein [Hyphomonadaceae bacterium]|nr:SPOR domain-containing protein [Hyphomonadaceae bacterium]